LNVGGALKIGRAAKEHRTRPERARPPPRNVPEVRPNGLSKVLDRDRTCAIDWERTMDSRSKAERFWDGVAKRFDRLEQKDEPTTQRIIAKTKTFLKGGECVLDVGCGTGTAAIALADSVKAITGIDISAGMIELARRKAVQAGRTNSAFVHTTIFDETLLPGSFDAVACFYVLHLVGDTAPVMERIHALLKPGGVMFSATPCIKGTLYGYVLPPLSAVGIMPPLTSFTTSGLVHIVTDTGFEIVETECVQEKGQQYFIAARRKE
jgi:ubiquinone/menaquinone biosynthesis C-methylase UbiE